MLQRILIPLEHTMLRQAFDRLPKLYYSWAPLWHALSGRRSYVILARSKECLDRLLKEPGIDLVLSAVRAGEKESPENPSLSTLLNDFFEEEATGSLNLGGPLLAVQDRMRTIAGQLITALLPYWRKKGSSETLEDIAAKAKEKDPPKISVQAVLAEEFVALRFMILIRYVSLQMRNQLFFIVAGFILTVLALRSYPFLASRAIGWTLTLIFATLATGVVFVLAQMSKDAILSRISDTKPGEVSGDFYVRVLSFGALPVLTLLASQFPSISRFLFSWVQPGIEALH